MGLENGRSFTHWRDTVTTEMWHQCGTWRWHCWGSRGRVWPATSLLRKPAKQFIHSLITSHHNEVAWSYKKERKWGFVFISTTTTDQTSNFALGFLLRSWFQAKLGLILQRTCVLLVLFRTAPLTGSQRKESLYNCSLTARWHVSTCSLQSPAEEAGGVLSALAGLTAWWRNICKRTRTNKRQPQLWHKSPGWRWLFIWIS